MLIIPELETVVITPPKAYSTSLAAAVKARYSKTIHLYRHAEACQIPSGYLGYKRIVSFRNPYDRLASLWRWMRDVDSKRAPNATPEWLASVNADAACDFETWLLYSNHTYDSGDAFYSTGFMPPVARRSVIDYGKHYDGKEFSIRGKKELERELDVTLPLLNVRELVRGDVAEDWFTEAMEMHLGRYFRADLDVLEGQSC